MNAKCVLYILELILSGVLHLLTEMKTLSWFLQHEHEIRLSVENSEEMQW